MPGISSIGGPLPFPCLELVSVAAAGDNDLSTNVIVLVLLACSCFLKLLSNLR